MKPIASDLEIIAAIKHYVDSEGIPPTIRELVLIVGFNSTSAIHYRVRVLSQKGYLTYRKRVARSIRLLEPAFQWLAKEKVS